MRISINGQPDSSPEGATVAALLERMELQPVRVAVEVNEELVPRRHYSEHRLREGDRVEIVTFVGGG